MTDWLSREAVAELTGTAPASFKAQRKRLQLMGVPFTPAFTGRPLVDPSAVAHNPKPRRTEAQPDWSALNAKTANRK
jgi:hypothetical protein